MTNSLQGLQGIGDAIRESVAGLIEDLKGLTALELVELKSEVDAETERRAVVANGPAALRELLQRQLTAEGLSLGDPWRQPLGAHDAYSEGWTVSHEGKLWESLISGNVWEPGDPTDPQNYLWWKNLTDLPQGDDWDPNGRAYLVGEEVAFQGSRYKCRQAHTSQPGWTPPAVPALWDLI